MRFRRWRLPVAVLLLLLVATALWIGWQGYHALRDLEAAEASADDLRDSLTNDEPTGRDQAIADLQDSARSARERTDGPIWGALTHLPIVGDDVRGVRAISSSLDTLATDAIPPLVQTVDGLDGITTKGRIDLDAVQRITGPVHRANAALASADADVADLDSSGYVGPLKTRFNTYVDLVGDAARGLSAGDKTVSVLPTMAGADGPRNYLMIFQNNAEIRATGGLPGSWALLHADRGELSMVQQGTASDFGERPEPILPLSKAEVAVYDRQLGTYFQDANFTPDFPRAADLWSARWEERFPGTKLDGVLSLDPVAMSYLLEGTGPIQVGNQTLTEDNIVESLLNRPYIELDPQQQDALFADTARALFDAVTDDLASPVDFVSGLDRAAHEGRFRVASFDPGVRSKLRGTSVEGALAGDDGTTPHVDIGLNDATGSKMSYYLRYWSDLSAIGCVGDRQTFAGSLTLKQSIAPTDAASLPISVTGSGEYGTERGSQLALVRLYGPFGGTIENVRLDGKKLDADVRIIDLDGRPVATVVVLLSNRDDAALTWTMQSGEGQTGDVHLGVTPSVQPGGQGRMASSGC
ncbi:MAG: DUF4012 domain-containing protein [Nocardioides sp.]|nr:DUF4012 domain-containing protein [Nocardioides sp.]